MTETITIQGLVCPVPIQKRGQVIMGHGSGGKLSHDLIADLFYPPFDNPVLRLSNDAGVVDVSTADRIAVSTDSHVVWPLFFPGGDIGKLAICGTVNDVAMMGAKPSYITAGFILEEGLELGVLEVIAASMREAAAEAGVQIIAGDTKVVDKGKADALYINTSGIGVLQRDVTIGGEQARPGDVVLLSGPVGDHGIAVLSARGELGFEADVTSDVAPLNHLVSNMLAASKSIHVLRDPTRGGVASALNEIAKQSGAGIVIEENKIPVRPAVHAACEMLGFDPLYIANEGKLIAIVARSEAEDILAVMRSTRYGEESVIIGEVVEKPVGRVLLKTAIGGTRIVDMMAGEMLPRIC
ncbi:MAG TPA: hydrogenase expression/formation protein HypE [candidate division Zixibacteria bacterium]|nr:hydrogenase expression/formation protein HypE [candidate division Zixibacteria bacterium]